MLLPYLEKGRLEAGCDEAGRGCLAGPVVAAAVILPEGYSNPLLNDSKQLTEKQRFLLKGEIEEKAVAWAVAFIDNHEVDKINVLNASIKAMNEAVVKLTVSPDFLLIDGNRFKNQTKIDYLCVVKGDGKYSSIAAASVLAKTHRDLYMMDLHEKYPHYFWNKNKGYPTLEHREAIQKFNLTEYHRKTFRVSIQQKLEF